jgi:hypothetical protein
LGTWKQYQFITGAAPYEAFSTNPPNSGSTDTYLTFPSSNAGQYTVTYDNVFGSFSVLNATECTYPSGVSGTPPIPPWWYFASGTVYCPTGSGHDSMGNIGGPADLTACTIYRPASGGYRSAALTGIKGIEFNGGFDGSMGIGGEHLYQTVFFGQQNCWGGGPEYGFTNDNALSAGPASFYFYWSTNTNCGSNCITSQYTGGSPTAVVPNAGAGVPSFSSYPVDYQPGDDSWFHAWIFQDTDSLYKFWVETWNGSTNSHYIIDPNTDGKSISTTTINSKTVTVVSGTAIYPAWYPIEALYGSTGFVTIGTQRNDMYGAQMPATAPYITVTGINVGK